MNNIIKPLPKHLIDLIAAGEVIERPLNVVKELVENSLDAKANEISISLIDCGIKEITVVDNGMGISANDLPIALEKHTTSKIQNESDLFKISTLGFRGEALSSISSVSDFYIASNNGETNYFIHKKAGDIIDQGIASINNGTKIVVKNLFFNTPARYKHLGNQYVELSLTQELVYKLALANPHVKFNLSNNGKVLFNSSNNDDLLEVILNCYGAEVAKSMIEFSGENNLYKIHGYTTNNEIFKSVRNHISIIINGRIIRNYSLIRAVLDAYQSILPIGKYPVTILNIDCNYELIDVNVHPSKLEIRFTDEQGLKELITRTIRDSLVDSELLKYKKEDYPKRGTFIEEDKKIYYESLPTQPSKIELENELGEDDDKDDNWENLFNTGSIKIIEPNIVKEDYQEQQSIDDFQKRSFFESLRYIGQYHVTYLIMEGNDELYLIDQHAAMERCRYEKLLKDYQKSDNKSFDLLVPITINLTMAEISLLKQKEIDLVKLGIIYEEFSPTSIIIRSIPVWIPKGEEIEYLNDIIYKLLNDKSTSKQEMLDDIIKQQSCKSSIKANMAIRLDEVNELMKSLDQCEMPYTCPHGRPTIIKFTNQEIEKMFKRINQ